jgi:hypothetical protein
MILPKSLSWLKRGAVVAALFAIMGFAIASPPPESSVSTQQPTIEELLRRLEGRDALIADLQRRVRDLEQRVTTTSREVSPAEQPPEQSSAVDEPAPSVASTANPEPPTPPKEETPVEGGSPPAAPGQFEVDEEAAERALERTLVLTGALLLPVGQVSFQPSFTYVRDEQGAPILFSKEGKPSFVATQDIRRNILNGDLFLRLGLPFDSQLELGAPYQYIEQENVTEIGFAVRDEIGNKGWGFGDFRLGLAKGLLREGRWWPSLIGRVTWDSDFGETDNGIPLGSGFNELSGSLIATKRQDPLVFFGSASYGTTFEKNNFDPGDNISFSVGTFLAASPDTSLSFILSQTFVDEIEVDNRMIDGTDKVIGTFSLGASSIIGRGKLLNFTTGIGLTDAAPDYSVGISMSMRFDVPGFF